jgi:hypothetical protein
MTSRPFVRALGSLVCLSLVSCATAAPEPPKAAEAPTVAAEPAEAAPAEPASDEPSAEAAPATEPPAAAETTPPEADPNNAQRDIRYVVTPDGLRAELLGVSFTCNAEAVKGPSGFGVKVTLEATASADRSMLAPEHGPLAFAGTIKRKGKAESETFGDERKGEGTLSLPAGKAVKLVREWPAKGKGGALSNGDVLELDVGLWGLGTTDADRRPAKQFLRVKLRVIEWKGRATVEPPPSFSGKKK